MLKSVVCRFNSLNSRNTLRITKHFGALQPDFNRKYGKTNDKSNWSRIHIAFAAVPTFLAFFQKKEDEDKPESESSFWDNLLPEEIALLFKKVPVEDEVTPEGKLKTTIKRTILAIRKKEYAKAEQMAHLALRMAQDIQNYDGITLCYDIMANLAFDLEQYQKAEKLFESVLQRLLQKGVPQDDIQVLHMSLKMAQLAELQNKDKDAKTNYTWTISKLDDKVKKEPNNMDLYELWGLTNNFYGKYLLKQGKFQEAVQRLKIAQEVFVSVRRRYDPDYVDIVNNLAVAYQHVKDYDSALYYIDEAINLGSAYPEMIETGIYHANKALICLQKGLIMEATLLCKHADRASKRSNDPGGIEQAKYCLEQLEKAMKKQK